MRFLDDTKLQKFLLYGHEKFKINENQAILKATMNYIRKTTRFSQIWSIKLLLHAYLYLYLVLMWDYWGRGRGVGCYSFNLFV